MERIKVQNYLGSDFIADGEGSDLRDYYEERLVSVDSSVATVEMKKEFNAKG